jgi:hypothetical protein
VVCVVWAFDTTSCVASSYHRQLLATSWPDDKQQACVIAMMMPVNELVVEAAAGRMEKNMLPIG